MNHMLFLLKSQFAWADSNKCAHSFEIWGVSTLFHELNNYWIIMRKKLFAHAKINNNKVECANLLLFAHANGYFNRNNTWFIWNKYYLEKKNDRVLPGPVGAVPPATQRMISWLINFIICLRVHIISYLPQVGQIISCLPTQNK